MLRISVRWDVMERPLELARAHNGDALPKCLFCRLNGPSWSASFLLQSKNRAPCNRSVFRHDAPAGQMTKRGLHRKFLGKKKKNVFHLAAPLSFCPFRFLWAQRNLFDIFSRSNFGEIPQIPFFGGFLLEERSGRHHSCPHLIGQEFALKNGLRISRIIQLNSLF